MQRIKVIIPTCNAGEPFKNLIDMLLKQVGITKDDILIADSESADNTVKIAESYGIKVIPILKKDFGHGKTRAMLADITDAEYIVFLTQDALPCTDTTISTICAYFDKDEKLGVVYGRQMPYQSTGLFGAHARMFNYPDKSRIVTFEDRKKLGIKAAFSSDSFACYKREFLMQVGNFPNVNFSEDAYIAGKMLMAGYKVGYCAEAKVYHAHDYNLLEEFTRYSEIGKFHKSQKWLLDTFGKAEGEGMKFVKSEADYLLRHGKWYLLPEAFIRTVFKYMGYLCGKM